MSAASDAIDVASSVLVGLAKAVPAFASWLRPSVEAQPDHALSKAVAALLPEHGRSEAALAELTHDS